MDPYDKTRVDAPDDPAIPANLFRPMLGIVAIGLLACVILALGLTDNQTGDGLSLPHCSAVTNDRERLACFDKLAEPRPPARGAFAILHNPLEDAQ